MYVCFIESIHTSVCCINKIKFTNETFCVRKNKIRVIQTDIG